MCARLLRLVLCVLLVRSTVAHGSLAHYPTVQRPALGLALVRTLRWVVRAYLALLWTFTLVTVWCFVLTGRSLLSWSPGYSGLATVRASPGPGWASTQRLIQCQEYSHLSVNRQPNICRLGGFLDKWSRASSRAICLPEVARQAIGQVPQFTLPGLQL